MLFTLPAGKGVCVHCQLGQPRGNCWPQYPHISNFYCDLYRCAFFGVTFDNSLLLYSMWHLDFHVEILNHLVENQNEYCMEVWFHMIPKFCFYLCVCVCVKSISHQCFCSPISTSEQREISWCTCCICMSNNPTQLKYNPIISFFRLPPRHLLMWKVEPWFPMKTEYRYVTDVYLLTLLFFFMNSMTFTWWMCAVQWFALQCYDFSRNDNNFWYHAFWIIINYISDASCAQSIFTNVDQHFSLH